MKLNSTPRHYMPLPQNQSDDDESISNKETNEGEITFKNSFEASDNFLKRLKENHTDEGNLKNLPMSTIRLTMFIISLMTCVLFVLTFVYCVPCTIVEDKICQVTYMWKRVFSNMTFTTPINTVNEKTLKNNIIVYGYESRKPGLMAIQESDGHVLWRLQLHSLPLFIDCNVLDVNLDGINECLVVGNEGLMAAIDVKTGSSFWYLHNHSDLNKAHSIHGTVIVSDFDGDDILDIVVSYEMDRQGNISYLAVVSGGTGQVLGSLVELPQCSGAAEIKFSWKYLNDTHFSIFCANEDSYDLWLLSSGDVYNAYTNYTKKLYLRNNIRKFHFDVNAQFYKISNSKENLFAIYDGYMLSLLNVDVPESINIIWELNADHDQAMKILTDGHFVNGSNQLVISIHESDMSKVVGLSLTDGKEMWSVFFDNGTVISAVNIPKFFEDTDALVLKMLSAARIYHSNIINESIGNESYIKKKFNEFTLKSLEEKYIIVKCGKIPSLKSISTEDVMISCETDGFCYPAVYVTNPTVIVEAVENDGSFNILTFTTKILTNSHYEEILIKSYKLVNNDIFSQNKGNYNG